MCLKRILQLGLLITTLAAAPALGANGSGTVQAGTPMIHSVSVQALEQARPWDITGGDLTEAQLKREALWQTIRSMFAGPGPGIAAVPYCTTSELERP